MTALTAGGTAARQRALTVLGRGAPLPPPHGHSITRTGADRPRAPPAQQPQPHKMPSEEISRALTRLKGAERTATPAAPPAATARGQRSPGPTCSAPCRMGGRGEKAIASDAPGCPTFLLNIAGQVLPLRPAGRGGGASPGPARLTPRGSALTCPTPPHSVSFRPISILASPHPDNGAGGAGDVGVLNCPSRPPGAAPTHPTLTRTRFPHPGLFTAWKQLSSAQSLSPHHSSSVLTPFSSPAWDDRPQPPHPWAVGPAVCCAPEAHTAAAVPSCTAGAAPWLLGGLRGSTTQTRCAIMRSPPGCPCRNALGARA